MIHSALMLPRLQAPLSFEFHGGGHNKVARLALILEELGVLTTADATGATALVHESIMVERALERWSTERTGQLRVLKSPAVVVNPDSVGGYVSMLEYAGNGDIDPKSIDAACAVIVALCPWDEAELLRLEPRCLDIQRRAPGLVSTALNALERGQWRSVLIATPEFIRYTAESMYGWEAGFEDEPAEGALTPEIFDGIVPRWASAPRRSLSRTKLEALANRGRDVGELARATIELQDAIGDRKALVAHVAAYCRSHFAAVLRWRDADPTARILDDYVNDAENGGESTSDFSQHVVKLETRAVADFLDRFGRMLRIVGGMDRVIAVIGEPA